MMKLGGFKASLNIFNSKRHSKDNDEFEPGLCITGAYRRNKDEYFGHDRVYEPPKRLTPSMVKLPECQPNTPGVRPTKSSGDITKPSNLPANLRYSTPSVSLDPRGEEETAPRNNRNGNTNVVLGNTNVVLNAKQEKEQAKLRKKQLDEQKARDKLEAKERAKQEKLAKAKERKEAKDKAKKDKKQKQVKSPIVQPPQQSTSSTTTTVVVAQQQNGNPLAQGSNYPTNTLESSISKTSGPPPYTERPVEKPESVPKTTPPESVKMITSTPESLPKNTSGTNDIIFSEPIDTGSWDMITQHRQQVSKTTKTTVTQSKQRVMDLNYNLHKDNDNSDA